MRAYVRPATPDDTDALYDICVRTGDAGSDARGRYRSDRLLGDLFAVPYLRLEPAHAFVLDDGAGAAVGYVLGTPDTVRFAERYRDEWIPATAGRIEPPADPPVTPEDEWRALHFHPEWRIVPVVADYPAHLHINLLPEWQGRGLGRSLMERLTASLREAGAPGVHLGMLTTNRGARAFYDKLGFVELPVPDAGPLTYLGQRI